MLSIGDRVYHKGAAGNGVIVTINNDYSRDKYGILFFWKKYKKMQLHNLNGFLDNNMGVWASRDKIIKTPLSNNRNHRVAIPGGKSLDKLIRKICELPRNTLNSGVAINYGTYRNALYDVFTINRNLMSNKYEQCMNMLGQGIDAPKTELSPFSSCIQKPFYSIGGKNINEYREGDIRYGYFQEKVNKRREFRAHVFLWGNTQVPLIQEKTVDDISQLTWNKKTGGKFTTVYQNHTNKQLINNDLIRRISTLSVAATKSIKYDMGGVDLALDSENNLYVFEINSRMGLRERSFITYKQLFWELYNLNVDEYKNNRY